MTQAMVDEIGRDGFAEKFDPIGVFNGALRIVLRDEWDLWNSALVSLNAATEDMNLSTVGKQKQIGRVLGAYTETLAQIDKRYDALVDARRQKLFGGPPPAVGSAADESARLAEIELLKLRFEADPESLVETLDNVARYGSMPAKRAWAETLPLLLDRAEKAMVPGEIPPYWRALRRELQHLVDSTADPKRQANEQAIEEVREAEKAVSRVRFHRRYLGNRHPAFRNLAGHSMYSTGN